MSRMRGKATTARRIRWRAGAAAVALLWACGHEANAGGSRRVARATPVGPGVCATPASGVVVSLDSVASLSTHAPLGELVRRCAASDTTLYDNVGWQAKARVFPFTGARILAIQSKRTAVDELLDGQPADLWTAAGDSVRLPDGQLLPRTLGELRRRYGRTSVPDNLGGDDFVPSAFACRFPYLWFVLNVTGTARHIPDSTRIDRVEMWIPPPQWARQICPATAVARPKKG